MPIRLRPEHHQSFFELIFFILLAANEDMNSKTKSAPPGLEMPTTDPGVLSTQVDDLGDHGDHCYLTYPEGGSRAWGVVFGSFCLFMSVFGIINSSAVFQSYFLENQLKEYSPSEVGWIFSAYLFMVYFVGLVVGPIFDRHGAREVVFVGSSLMVASPFILGSCTGEGLSFSQSCPINVLSNQDWHRSRVLPDIWHLIHPNGSWRRPSQQPCVCGHWTLLRPPSRARHRPRRNGRLNRRNSFSLDPPSDSATARLLLEHARPWVHSFSPSCAGQPPYTNTAAAARGDNITMA